MNWENWRNLLGLVSLTEVPPKKTHPADIPTMEKGIVLKVTKYVGNKYWFEIKRFDQTNEINYMFEKVLGYLKKKN